MLSGNRADVPREPREALEDGTSGRSRSDGDWSVGRSSSGSGSGGGGGSATGPDRPTAGLLGIDHGQHAHLDTTEGIERGMRRAEEIKNLVNIVQVLSHDRVRRAEGTNSHLLAEYLPIIEHAVDGHAVIRVVTLKPHGFKVHLNQVTLSCLIELELDDLRTAFAAPLLSRLFEGVGREAALLKLAYQEGICSDADHELHFAVDAGLCQHV